MCANSKLQCKGSLLAGLPFFFLSLAVSLTASVLFPAPALGQTASTAKNPPPASSSADTQPIPSEWRDSKEALLGDVLRYLQAGNLRGLAAITVDSADYKAVVWPELPISNPRNNIPFDYVFGRHNQLSRGGLFLKLKDLKGKRFEVVRFEERPERDQYKEIRIIPIGEIVLKDAEGKELEVRLVGSILEHKGRFKVFSYKTD